MQPSKHSLLTTFRSVQRVGNKFARHLPLAISLSRLFFTLSANFRQISHFLAKKLFSRENARFGRRSLPQPPKHHSQCLQAILSSKTHSVDACHLWPETCLTQVRLAVCGQTYHIWQPYVAKVWCPRSGAKPAPNDPEPCPLQRPESEE